MDAVISWFGKLMEQDKTTLVQGLRGGDPNVVDGLIEVYQHRLLRYLMSLTGNRATAEDLFQETWLRVLERGNQYNANWNFDVWLFSIARHLAIDLARRKKDRSLDELLNPEDGPGFQPAANDPSPFDEMSSSERGRHMSRILAGIPAVYREVITLRFHEDLALDEVAAVIKAPLSTAKSRLYRGLESIRRIMEEQKA